MKFYATALWLGLLLIPEAGWAQDANTTSATKLNVACQIAPERRGAPTSCSDVSDILPDATTAYTVGMAILKERYGAGAVEYPEPYEATFDSRNEEWCVDRALFPPGVSAKDRLPRKGGGHPYVCLSKKDGRVTLISRSL
ncbi:YbbC/YhhH family protein [Microvirga sp. ACRRW]|uniref:NTF2 fold immunity protein n=1 Tax=Microvirga sp. ACRRW TaxID=2918205 RepID=UPI001EF4DEBB|nr:NTF2 fold immunity protein [Microvirga sp. ACRRW]MCG7393035.1 YbbC/YhhH family protein [Microvirga sp. ACRRW]